MSSYLSQHMFDWLQVIFDSTIVVIGIMSYRLSRRQDRHH